MCHNWWGLDGVPFDAGAWERIRRAGQRCARSASWPPSRPAGGATRWPGAASPSELLQPVGDGWGWGWEARQALNTHFAALQLQAASPYFSCLPPVQRSLSVHQSNPPLHHSSASKQASILPNPLSPHKSPNTPPPTPPPAASNTSPNIPPPIPHLQRLLQLLRVAPPAHLPAPQGPVVRRGVRNVWEHTARGHALEPYWDAGVGARAHTHTHARTQTRTHTYTHTRTHIHTRTHARTHACTHTCTGSQAHCPPCPPPAAARAGGSTLRRSQSHLGLQGLHTCVGVGRRWEWGTGWCGVQVGVGCGWVRAQPARLTLSGGGPRARINAQCLE